jgi:hypothetical protein
VGKWPARELSATYWLHATHCIEVAGKSADLGNKLSLLNMARAWMLLAEQAEKNSENVTPGPTKEA